MFNSPIGRMFGVSGIGQERNKQQSNKDDEQPSQNEENPLFKDDNKLYSDISTDELDIELYVRKFFNDLKDKDISERSYRKIQEFLSNFNKESFIKKYGVIQSKEDLSVILYCLAEKFGVKIWY